MWDSHVEEQQSVRHMNKAFLDFSVSFCHQLNAAGK
jgi:hypothetical protein